MPKTRRVFDVLEAYRRSRAPQVGFFSVLDEMIAEAPFEKASAQEWRNYLQPNRTIKREGINFPLKKEELDYSGLRTVLSADRPQGRSWTGAEWKEDTHQFTKEELRQVLLENRPQFDLRSGSNDPGNRNYAVERLAGSGASKVRLAGPRYQVEGLYHERPLPTDPGERAVRGIWGTPYEESVTEIRGLDYPSHFGESALSWSRTTTHETPEKQFVRLVEEIQSDLHEAAAERPSEFNRRWEGFLTPEERNEIAQIEGSMRSLRDFSTRPNAVDFDQHLTPEGRQQQEKNVAGYARIEEIQNRAKARYPSGRRGYRTSGEEEELKALRQAYLPRYSTTIPPYELPGAARRNELSQKPPDAPFKDPGDYGLLELKKQLINAVNADEDWLALTRPEDQIARYAQGMDETRTGGMEHIYGKIYPSALNKLARRYGADVGEVTVPVRGAKDVRLSAMIEEEIETPDDAIAQILYGQAGQHRDNVPDPEFGFRILEDLQDVLPEEQFGDRIQTAMDLLTDLEDLGEGELNEGLEEKISDVFMELLDAYRAGSASSQPTTAVTKTFPAMRLTPEIRERISRIGVPLWALTGAGVLAGQVEDEEPKFAEGGEVDTGIERLKSLSRTLGRLLPGRSEETYERNEKLNKHFLSALASQWYGLDPETGKVKFARGWPITSDVRPGIVDETMALPLLGELIEPISTVLSEKYDIGNPIEYTPPDWATRAGERTEEIGRQLNEQFELEPPHGLDENIAEAGGVMLGQIPIPTSILRNLGPRPSALRRALSSPPEWFLPTVEATPSAYAVGTGFGGILNTMLDKLSGPDPEREFEELAAEIEAEEEAPRKKARGGKVRLKHIADDLRDLWQKGSWTRPQGWPEEIPDEEVQKELEYRKRRKRRFPKGQAYAGGGRVKTATDDLLKLRELLMGTLRTPEVEKGKELAEVEQSLTPEQLQELVQKYDIDVPAGTELSLETLLQKLRDAPMSRRDFLEHTAGLAAKKFLPNLDLPKTEAKKSTLTRLTPEQFDKTAPDTWRQGSIRASHEDLVKLFGEPEDFRDNYDKISHGWMLKAADGTPIFIHDWKDWEEHLDMLANDFLDQHIEDQRVKHPDLDDEDFEGEDPWEYFPDDFDEKGVFGEFKNSLDEWSVGGNSPNAVLKLRELGFDVQTAQERLEELQRQYPNLGKPYRKGESDDAE